MALIEKSFAGVTIAELIDQSSQSQPLCSALGAGGAIEQDRSLEHDGSPNNSEG